MNMYNYRKLSQAQKDDILHTRKLRKLPLHSPPHYPDGRKTYILTAACFEHKSIISEEIRRQTFQEKLLNGLHENLSADIRAWVILPNHFHLLICLDLEAFRLWIRKFNSGISTEWNRDDNFVGRKVWYRFQDRAIRNDAHYFASLNYIHANPVKHGYVKQADEWKCSSIHEYLLHNGRDELVQLWKNYPVDNYGDKWDEF